MAAAAAAAAGGGGGGGSSDAMQVDEGSTQLAAEAASKASAWGRFGMPRRAQTPGWQTSRATTGDPHATALHAALLLTRLTLALDRGARARDQRGSLTLNLALAPALALAPTLALALA